MQRETKDLSSQDTIQEGLERQRIRAEIEKLSAEAEKLKSESRHFRSPTVKWLPLITAFAAIIGVLYSVTQLVNSFQKEAEQRRQVEQRRHTEEQFHQDELFSKAVAQLESPQFEQRAASIVALAGYASRAPEYRNLALTLITLALQTEKDPSVLQVTINALPQFGTPALEILIQQNRQVYEQLAQATGRYLGVESMLQRIKIPGHPSLYDIMAVYLFKLNDLAQRTSLPWQTAFTPDTEFFQTPDSLAIHPRFRAAFKQTIDSRKVTPKDEMDSENEFRSSIHDLWVNTQAIVNSLRALSGNLAGLNFRRTLLLRPNLKEVNLRGIDARSAVWMAPVLTGADLSFSDLSTAEMKYADLRHVNLTGTNLAGVNFGNRNKKLEDRTLTELRFVQNNVLLDGANVWEMADCYLKTQKFDPTKLQESKDARQRILATPEAKKYLDKIRANPNEE